MGSRPRSALLSCSEDYYMGVKRQHSYVVLVVSLKKRGTNSINYMREKFDKFKRNVQSVRTCKAVVMKVGGL